MKTQTDIYEYSVCTHTTVPGETVRLIIEPGEFGKHRGTVYRARRRRRNEKLNPISAIFFYVLFDLRVGRCFCFFVLFFSGNYPEPNALLMGRRRCACILFGVI